MATEATMNSLWASKIFFLFTYQQKILCSFEKSVGFQSKIHVNKNEIIKISEIEWKSQMNFKWKFGCLKRKRKRSEGKKYFFFWRNFFVCCTVRVEKSISRLHYYYFFSLSLICRLRKHWIFLLLVSTSRVRLQKKTNRKEGGLFDISD